MKSVFLVLVATSFLSGCTALAIGAAGATVANPKGAGQIVTDTGEAIRDIGKKATNAVK
jgi:hypothetical protein